MSDDAKTLADREAEVRKFYERMQENGMKLGGPAPHDCGVCHECEMELAHGHELLERVCLQACCSRFALGDGRQSPYFGPCPIEGGQ